jgi:hypothetical protein
MTTYKEIFGKYVKNYSSDPSSDAEGQIWYNTTSGTFKSEVLVADAWASGGNMTTARGLLAGAGTQTAGLAFGGNAESPITGATEEYNGSTWTAGGSLSTARSVLGGCGIQTAGLAFGGVTTVTVANTEEYDGTAWTAGGSLNTARGQLAGAGLQTAGLGFGGETTVNVANTEEYTGTIITTTPSILTTS